jgi:two-component system, OmpR family, sensor histidine kinase ChvG
VIFGILLLLAGVVSRGVTRPIEQLSAATRDVAAGGGEVPETPATAAVEIRALYEDFRAMAERIERRSGYLRDFAAAVSHEFKTPLAGITGAVELLQDHFETMSAEERRRFLDNIAADSERLSQLVGRLLDLARADMASPEAGAAADLAEPLRRAADAQRSDDFQVDVSVPPDLPPIAVPAATLESVFAILFQNRTAARPARAA